MRAYLSIMFITLGLIFLPIPEAWDSSSRHWSLACWGSTFRKSYGVPALPKNLKACQYLCPEYGMLTITYRCSSKIHWNRFSKFTLWSIKDVFSFSTSPKSCSSFLRESSASEISCFFVLRSRSRSASSLSKATRTASSFLSLVSAALWSLCDEKRQDLLAPGYQF